MPNRTNPNHYHSITKVTKRWKALIDAEQSVETNTPAQRAKADREQKHQEVHVTGKTDQPKGA